MKIFSKSQSAFTLLELLITLFIISIIISLSVVVYDVSWAKSRNSKRVGDIVRVQNALESYHLQEGKYPDTLTFGSALIGESTSSPITYLAALPSNPTPRADGDCADQEYQYSTSTNAYGDDNFFIEFCVGNNTDQVEKGINCATSQGITHGTCDSTIIAYTLTYTAGAGGSIVGISPQTVSSGENGSEVLASPDTGYSFVNWSDGSTTNPRTDTIVVDDISVTANFSIDAFTLTYTAGAGGSITGTSPQTVNSGENGSAVTAVPDPGYDFVDWSDDSTANPRTDTNVTGNISVTATFVDNGQNVFLGTTNSDWGTATNWSRGTVPTATDGYVTTFNASSPNCTINTSARVANAIDFTNYTNTITMTFSISVYGGATLGASMTIAGTGYLSTEGASTLTSNGKVWPNILYIHTSTTLLDNWTVGNLQIGPGGNYIINGYTIYTTGQLYLNTSSNISGTTNIVMSGTGTWSSVSTGRLDNNLTFNTTGTITVSGNVYYGSGTLTYTAGTMVTTGSLLYIYANTTVVLNTGGMTWNNVQITNSTTLVTLLSDLNIGGNLSAGITSVATTISGYFNVNIGGSLTSSITTGYLTGTATIVMNGTGTISTPNATTGTIRIAITINTAGTITFSGIVNYGASSISNITYTAGTVVTTSSTLNLIGTATLNTNGIAWNNVTLGGTSITYTLTSDMDVNGTLTLSGTTATTINGSTIYLGGSLTQVTASLVISGTTNIIMNGTGTWSNASTGQLQNNLTFNTAGTITISGTVYYDTGALTYSTGTMITTGSLLSLSGSTTLNTNGMTWNNFTFGGTSATFTLSSNLDIDGTLTLNGTTAQVINGSAIYAGANFSTNTLAVTGTTYLVLNGTGTWIGGAYISLDMEINTAGTITLGNSGGYCRKGAGLMKYTAGTIIQSYVTSFAFANGATLDLDGITWNVIALGGATVTYTLSADLTVTDLTLSGSGAVAINENTVYISGDLKTTSTGTASGTTNLVMNGTGTWSNSSTGYLRNNLTFNTAGTITVSGNIRYSVGTITYTAGTMITTNNILICNSSTSFDTDGMIWNNIIWTGTSNYNLLSDFTAAGYASLGAATVPTSINGADLYVGGNLTTNTTTGSITGTGTIILNGTGNWDGTTLTTGTWNIPIVINTTGTITLASDISFGNSLASLTYTAGTFVTTGYYLKVGNMFLDMNGYTVWGLYITQATLAVTKLASNILISGDFINSATVSHQTIKRSNSEYPPAQSATYVKATTYYSSSYYAYFATDPGKSVIDGYPNAAWMASVNTNQRFHIDLGSAKTIKEVYYENVHHLGTATTRGVKNFTLWGSNSATDFDDLVYANDGTWTQLTTDISQFAQHPASNVADPQYITVTNSTAYRYYAFKFADNWGDASLTGVRRIELREENTPRYAVLTLLAGATHTLSLLDVFNIDSSSGTPMISAGGILSDALNWSN